MIGRSAIILSLTIFYFATERISTVFPGRPWIGAHGICSAFAAKKVIASQAKMELYSDDF
jgi:hypothetical protein